MTYDHWKTTNPLDEFLGPEPGFDEGEPEPTEPLDVALLIELWQGGPACRDVALDMADQFRKSREAARD